MAKDKTKAPAVATDLDSLREAKKATWKELSSFRMKHKLQNPGTVLTDKGLKATHKSLTEAYESAKAAFEAAESKVKADKPARQVKGKYDYPKDIVTPDQKKKYRAEQRRLNKKDAAPAKPAKEKATAKKETTAAAPVAKAKVKKKKTASKED